MAITTTPKCPMRESTVVLDQQALGQSKAKCPDPGRDRPEAPHPQQLHTGKTWPQRWTFMPNDGPFVENDKKMLSPHTHALTLRKGLGKHLLLTRELL